MNNYANFSNQDSQDKFSNSNMTFAFGREMDFKNNSNIEILNDRDIFNKLSNTNDSIDTSSFNLSNSYGMPIQGGCTTNNKKSLLATPYIMESNNKNKWVSTTTAWNQNDMYAELEFDKTNGVNKHSNGINSTQNQDSMLDMSYNNKLSCNQEDNGLCKIEIDCLGFEYELTKQKQKEIVIDISSPFALAYIWKTLILLSKNPSTDKFIKMLGIKNKDSIVSDMKRHAEVFEDSGKLEVLLPPNSQGQTANTNYINKIQ